MAALVKIGLIGGNGGNPQDLLPGKLPKTLEKIDIWSLADDQTNATVILGIRFHYIDVNDTPITVNLGQIDYDGSRYHELTIDTASGDYLNKVEGMFDKTEDPGDGDIGITSLSFTTKHGKRMKCGNSKNGTAFIVPLDNAGIFAFFAKADSNINALGFYAQNVAP